MTSKELREKRAPLVVRTGEMRDKANKEDRVFTDEEQTNWDRLHKDYGELTTRITQAELQESRESEQTKIIDDLGIGLHDLDGREGSASGNGHEGAEPTGPTDQDRNDAIRAWCMAGKGRAVPDNHRAAAKRCGFDLGRVEIEIPLPDEGCRQVRERRALSTITGAAGGVLIPEGFTNRLEIALLQWGSVKTLAETIRTSEGNALPWPSMDDTGNEGALLAENSTVSEQDVAFKGIVLNAYKYESKAIKVPSELMQDSAFNLPSLIGKALGERLARIQNRHLTVGDGNSKAHGVVTDATVGKTTSSTTAFTYDEIMDLFHSVDPAYREAGQWMMNDTVLLALKKLKDGEGNYLWRSGDLSKGVPDTIENKPYSVNQHMASSIVASAKILLFGDFSSYKVREVNMVSLKRLDELYAAADQVGFMAFMRFDGALLDAGTNPMKVMQMSA